jgi:hypothetical protein
VKVTIDSIWVDNKINFNFRGIPSLPVVLNSGQNRAFVFSFIPDSVGNFQTIVHFRSIEAGIRTAILTGCGVNTEAVNSDGYTTSLSKGSAEYATLSLRLDAGNDIAMLPPVPNPLTAGAKSIRFVYGLRSDSPIDLSIYDIIGNQISLVVHNEHESAGIYEAIFHVGADMPSGGYIYRLAGTGKVISGRFVVTR